MSMTMKGSFIAMMTCAAAVAGADGPAAAASSHDDSLSVAALAVLADGATKKRSFDFQMGDAIHVTLAPGNLQRL